MDHDASMIQQILKFWIILFLISCGQINTKDSKAKKGINKNSFNSKEIEKNDDSQIDQNDFRKKSINLDFKESKIYNLDEQISEDLNGDGVIDKAEFKKRNDRAGIIITDGKSNNQITIGLGNKFAHMDDFRWVDFWGIVKDSVTYEVVFKDDEIVGDTIVKLEHPSIFVRKDEVGGGVITYKNGTFVWIHQAD